MNDAIEQFRREIEAAGLPLPAKIVADGKLHRFATNGKASDDSGWYVLHRDNIPAGYFGCWRAGVKQKWQADIGRELTPAENQANRERMDAMKAARDADEAERRAEAAAKTAWIWERAQQARADHPYFLRKSIMPVATLRELPADMLESLLGYPPKCKDGPLTGRVLIAPVEISGKASSLEMIDELGRKVGMAGGKKGGGYWAAHPLPDSLDTLLIGEGVATALSAHEATGHPAIAALGSGNLGRAAQTMRRQYPAARLVILGDLGNGQAKASDAAKSVDGSVALPAFTAEELAVEKPPTDWNDMAQLRGLEAVKAGISAACSAPMAAQTEHPVNDTTGDYAAAVARLAGFKPHEYDRVRKAEAKRQGVQISTLDNAVRDARARQDGGNSLFPDVEPWPDPVDGASLLDEIAGTVKRFIICEPEIAEVAAIWIVFSWLIDHFQIAPMILITAPEMRCGKTQLLSLIGKMARRPLMASNISPAATYRVIEAHAPTLLIDEADAFFRDNEDLRGIVNSGHGRDSAYVLRTVGENFDPRRFSTWGAKVLCGIGRLQSTLMDRSLILELRRKAPGETAEKLRHANPASFAALASRLSRFADDNGVQIGQARPDIPNALHDRAQDNAEPLLAIADFCGGGWPDRARAAILKIAGATAEADTMRGGLLADIAEVFRATGQDRISTVDLIEALCADDTKPYATWARGKPMTPRHLANKLAMYRITPKTIRIGGVTAKGFLLADFADTFGRYLSASPDTPILSVTPSQPAEILGFFDNLSVTAPPDVTDRKPPNPLKTKDCYGVTDRTPPPGEKKDFDGDGFVKVEL